MGGVTFACPGFREPCARLPEKGSEKPPPDPVRHLRSGLSASPPAPAASTAHALASPASFTATIGVYAIVSPGTVFPAPRGLSRGQPHLVALRRLRDTAPCGATGLAVADLDEVAPTVTVFAVVTKSPLQPMFSASLPVQESPLHFTPAGRSALVLTEGEGDWAPPPLLVAALHEEEHGGDHDHHSDHAREEHRQPPLAARTAAPPAPGRAPAEVGPTDRRRRAAPGRRPGSTTETADEGRAPAAWGPVRAEAPAVRPPPLAAGPGSRPAPRSSSRRGSRGASRGGPRRTRRPARGRPARAARSAPATRRQRLPYAAAPSPGPPVPSAAAARSGPRRPVRRCPAHRAAAAPAGRASPLALTGGAATSPPNSPSAARAWEIRMASMVMSWRISERLQARSASSHIVVR